MTPTEEFHPSPKSYHLQWNNHSSNLQSLLQYHFVEKKFADVTLHCPDGYLVAHKIVLSSCSSYFESVLSLNPNKHASIILRDIPLQTLKLIVAYMYFGSVDIPVTELPSLLVIANELRIKGLIQDTTQDEDNSALNTSPITPASSPTTDIEPGIDYESQKSFPPAETKDPAECFLEAVGSSHVVDENISEDVKTVNENQLAENLMRSISRIASADDENGSQKIKHQTDQHFPSEFTEEQTCYPADLFCSTCNRGFLNKQNMKRHMQTHSGVKPHQCNFCSLSFLRLSHLLRHHRVHTGERPFTCDGCGKQFSRSDKLKQHIVQHHSGVIVPKQPKQRGRPRKLPMTSQDNGVGVNSTSKIFLENVENAASVSSHQALQSAYSLSAIQ